MAVMAESGGTETIANATRSTTASRTSPSPVVTVVTVALNAGDGLKATMESVFEQTYPTIEYIVIDGGSTDGSVEFIKSRSDRLAFWTSEGDRGIYDGMNKAIARACGGWVIFMNAGDGFASPTVIAEVMEAVSEDTDFLYGDVEAMSGRGWVRVRARPLEVMWQRISFSHQSLFARTELMKASPFNLTFDVIADYAFYFTHYCEGRRFQYAPLTVARIAPAGYSEKKLWRRTFERWRIVRRHRRAIDTDLFYLKLIATEILPIQARRWLKGKA